MKLISISYLFLVNTAQILFWAVFTFLPLWSQSESAHPLNQTRLESGLVTSWHPVRSATYAPGRLDLKLHDSPSPELYFSSSVPLGKKGLGLEIFASFGIIPLKESFTVDSVLLDGQLTDDRFRLSSISNVPFGRVFLNAYWQQEISGTPLFWRCSAGFGASLYAPISVVSLGVLYPPSSEAGEVSIFHMINTSSGQFRPHFFVPVSLRLGYLFKNGDILSFFLRGGFSPHILLNGSYQYARGNDFFESGEGRVRDISIGAGLGYGFSLRRSKSR